MATLVAGAGLDVSALVGLLSDHRPEELGELRTRYPEYELLLYPGAVLGDIDAGTRMLVEVALQGLRLAQERAEPNLRRLRTRLARAKLLRLIGNVISTLTGAGLIAALVTDAQLLAKIAAVVSFAVTLFTLVASHLETPVDGGAGSLLETYRTLIMAQADAPQLIGELEACLHSEARTAEIEEVVRRSNELARGLRLVERVL